jgi:pimeloyl-ACP methyl ester carboxylesterase
VQAGGLFMRHAGSGAAMALVAMLVAGAGQAGADDKAHAAAAKPLPCNDALKAAFRPDRLTTVVAVKAFRKGDPLLMTGTATLQTPRAANDLCMVKLNVGPGNPGPVGAPSTSPGIGIEVWLPTPGNWNGRVHAVGGNGWSGGNAGSPIRIANAMYTADIAATEGSVTSSCDSGHSGMTPGLTDVPASNGAFAFDPDGTLSKAQWKDFSSRSLHEQAVKTKALATVYYGRAPRHSYFEGVSQGGRQGLKLAQEFPADYDGIVANAPAINWSQFFTAMSYPQIIAQRELGGVPLTEAQQDLVGNAAIHACDVVGGQHLGYIMDMPACRYDPTLDVAVLCPSDGGKNTTADCVTKVQANVINKLWYGNTADGSVPSPAVDNGWDKELDAVHRWYGHPRGTSLYNASIRRLFPMMAPVATPGKSGPPTGGRAGGHDQLAIELQNPTIAGRGFNNASGDGADLWKTLSYAQFNNAFDRGLALQPVLDHINTDNPDLSAFKARGGKLLTWHGYNDEAIPVQGSIQYYRKVIEKLGGLVNVQSFYRFYLVPGYGHNGMQGTTDPEANPPILARGQFYPLMVDWVEKGIAPDRVELVSPTDKPVRITQPICPYPQKATYQGGDPRVTTSFACS